MGFKVYNSQCKNCLFSKDALVSPERRSELVKQIKEEQTFFVCHNSSLKGDDENICCKKFYDKLGHYSQQIRIAERLDLIEWIDQEPEDGELMSHREIKELIFKDKTDEH